MHLKSSLSIISFNIAFTMQDKCIKPVFHFHRNVSQHFLCRSHQFHTTAQETKKYATFRYDTIEVENWLNSTILYLITSYVPCTGNRIYFIQHTCMEILLFNRYIFSLTFKHFRGRIQHLGQDSNFNLYAVLSDCTTDMFVLNKCTAKSP